MGGLLFGVVLSLALAACGRQAPVEVPAPSAPFSATFTIAVGGQPVRAQIAVRDWEMEHGLMGRRDLGPDDGMIFVYRAPTALNFWMRNTPTPLDIGYFGADGVLRELYPMFPFDDRTIASRSRDLQFALEVNQGWYESHHVVSGATLDLKALAAALRARGFDPAQFGLGRTP